MALNEERMKFSKIPSGFKLNFHFLYTLGYFQWFNSVKQGKRKKRDGYHFL